MALALVALGVPASHAPAALAGLELGAALPNSALAPEAEMQPAAAKELAFIHIPKTGGTSIEEAGAQVGFSWGQHFNFSATNTQSSACNSLYHVPPGMLETHPYAAFDTFCAKRHPYTRAISQYLFYTVATDPGCQGKDPGVDCPGILSRVCNAAGLNAYIDGVTARIRGGVLAIPGLLGPVDQSAETEDCHWLPQWMYIGDGGTELCKSVLRQENLQADWAVLLEGRDDDARDKLLRVRELLASHSYKDSSGCSLQVGDLNGPSRKQLQEIFAKDFEALDYGPELVAHAVTLAQPPGPGQPWQLSADEWVSLDRAEMEEATQAARHRRAARSRTP